MWGEEVQEKVPQLSYYFQEILVVKRDHFLQLSDRVASLTVRISLNHLQWLAAGIHI